MLRSIKQLYGDKLGAKDGDIGSMKDFYFDDQQWVVRYVVVDTGSWLPGRLVLISPHAFSDFPRDGGTRRVNLTRAQIKDSPSAEVHKPVSRQFEEEYYAYYQYPNYWDGGAMWGMGGYPMPFAMQPVPNRAVVGPTKAARAGDPHLRSTQALHGYDIQTPDGEIGHVVDFIVHEKSWAITHLIVETGHWYSGKEIAIASKHIERISYEDAKVFVNVTKEAIQDAPEYQVPPWAYEDAPSIAD